MKNVFQIFLLLLVSVVIFSCEKEEDSGSNPPIINGCTDANAMNYMASANTDDGSCVFAYDIAQGNWNIDPDCEEYTIPLIGTTISLNDQLPETINVEGGGNNMLYIEINETQVNGQIDNVGNITVSNQTISIEMDGFGEMPIDVEGSGVISSSNSGNMNLTYTFSIETIPGFPIEESLDCSIVLSK